MMAGLLGTGCTYLRNRGHDAADMLEIGITVSSKPQFAFHPLDYFNTIILGYSSVEGTYYGIGERRIGKMPFKDERTWGLLLWGSDTLKIGKFNPNDPHLAWKDEMAKLKAEGKPLPTERPRYNKGLVTLIKHDNSPPPITFMQCRRNIHLGWIGFHASLRPLDIIDFILGWTTLDIIGDDRT
jgi:hypothetical protein